VVSEGHIQSTAASTSFLTCIVRRLPSTPSASELLPLALAGELHPLASEIQLLPLVQLSPLSLPSSREQKGMFKMCNENKETILEKGLCSMNWTTIGDGVI
jgi:hypothetical protein